MENASENKNAMVPNADLRLSLMHPRPPRLLFDGVFPQAAPAAAHTLVTQVGPRTESTFTASKRSSLGKNSKILPPKCQIAPAERRRGSVAAGRVPPRARHERMPADPSDISLRSPLTFGITQKECRAKECFSRSCLC